MTTIFANIQIVQSACNTLIIRLLPPPPPPHNSLSIKQLRGFVSFSRKSLILTQYVPLCRAISALYKGLF
jgi:hypothetical protein